ncbi:hypothetical protein GCM10007989_12650 [Devosia pacifica]|uniref:Curlin n=1 Tax=Devosia pacifica TaxID=1335967 RepID=A0A918S128_9HYPH|nr:CsgG/HfaB family protein [Devosia pacifica]GHA18796.1 hypothetical protein GCM10007989_12650 [Devosia pacifica]
MSKTLFLGQVLKAAVLLGAAAALAGCSSHTLGRDPLMGGLEAPVISPVSKQNYELRTVPPPKERVTVAVYDFPDLTGQFREAANFQTSSRAVTQGGSTILIKALQDASERRWFTVLDRAALDNLLKERQIVTEMRRIYRGEEVINASALPPLAHAGIILEGGIIGYDTNAMTGGAGARYLGIGGDTKWTQDVVTVTLRAVSTATSEVLASVTVHKMLASQSLQGGIFQYASLDSIIEAEAGVTQNEPKQIAVQQAIEKAVLALIVEGAELDIWQFGDREAGERLVEAYRQEKYGVNITAQAYAPVPPVTRNATDVVETRPLPVAMARRPAPPAAAPAQPTQPSPANTQSAPEAPPRPATPPPASEGEVIGSIPPVAVGLTSG